MRSQLFACALLIVPALLHAQEDVPSQLSLLDIARAHIDIALESRADSQLWGRIAGSAAERKSAQTLAAQLKPYVDRAWTEEFTFEAPRPKSWRLELQAAGLLESAMPAPFDALFPQQIPPTAIVHIDPDREGGWKEARGKWAFVAATMELSPSRTSVRKQLLYQRAVEAGALGFVFSIPTPPGRWQAVVPIDKPYALQDVRYRDHVRPIPCFCIDSDDGKRLQQAIADGQRLKAAITFSKTRVHPALNAVAQLDSSSDRTILLMAHLDSFFTGANDDASGMAALVGVAQRLSQIPQNRRKARFLFASMSAHHDEAAGMRAFLARDEKRTASIGEFILLEHVDARVGDLAGKTDWPQPLNNRRAAFVGPDGWPELENGLGELVQSTGLMTQPPAIRRACIADLFVVCDSAKTFCLMQGPPYYHTTHDTLDKISEQGIADAVEFHIQLLARIGAIEL